MSSCVHGISSYIKKLEKIADECGTGKQVGKEEEPKDEFDRTKKRMYQLIEDVRVGVHERQTLIGRRGICHETIVKGHENRQKMEELQRSLQQLPKLNKQAKGKKDLAQKREELKARYEDIRALKTHVEDCKGMIESANAGTDDFRPAAEVLGLRDTARSRGDPNTARELTSEEQAAMGDMRANDAKIDEDLGQFGKVADRLRDVALNIGTEAENQKKKAELLTAAVDKNTKEIERQTAATLEIIKYEKSTTQCCQMVLGLVLLCIVGFIFNQMNLGSAMR